MRSRPTWLIATALFAFASEATPAAAQHASQDDTVRTGYWVSGGAGGGVSDEGTGGFGLYLRMGGTPSQHVAVGGEAIGVVDAGGAATVTLGNLTAVLLIDSGDPGGLVLKGGLGLASFRTRIDELDVTADDHGVGVTLGAGYDIRIGSNLWLSPNLDVLVQSFDGFADSSVFVLTVGVGAH